MSQNPIILIVDDEKNTREGLRDAFEDGFDVYVAADLEGAMAAMQDMPPDVLITDLRLGGEDGMVLLDYALKRPKPPISIMMTAYGSVDTAVEAMKRGAYDFVTKPVNIDRLEMLIRRALRGRDVESENIELKQQVEKKFGFEALIGESACMVKIFDIVRQVAPSRATVLIQGESGTGKELAAHAIHNLSSRSKARFVAVHCAALPGTLLESELFGYEKGAFTGATERRAGRFEQAEGGTLFLDEIGEIDSTTQVKILRVLGEREFERLGSGRTIKTDVRLVAATNKDLEQLVKEGKFREDLFFRLNVVQLRLPALRDRREDIPLLVQAFLKEEAQDNAKPFRELSSEAMTCLLNYDWPGNVRELKTAVEHGVVMATGAKIEVRDLPLFVRDRLPMALSPSRQEAFAPAETHALNLQQTELALIMRALEESNGNRTEASNRLGISRRTLHRRLKELHIKKN
ncbi:MAG: sigma-54 dependent transcriptional regulator [Chthoniobacterales bacterium]